MGKNKAQVTLIIAIAIFIFIIAALVFYIANYYKKNLIEPLVFERASIENYINNCVKKTAEDGLKLFGKKGIVIDNNKIPSIEIIQNELSSYVDNNLNICLKDFEDFEKQGWDIEKGSMNTKTQINEQDASFEVNYPLKISDKVNVLNFDRFAINLNVRLKYLYNIVNEIADFHSKYPKSINRVSLSKYDVQITIFPHEGYLIFKITDYKSLIMNKPYELVLRIKS